MTDAAGGPPPPRKRSFGPVVDAQTRLLLLGSLPGERSLSMGQYYANPHNQFWRLIGAVLECDLLALAYQDRLDMLLRSGVGLWDVIASAERRGSLDADIRGHSPNALAELAESLPKLKAVGFNGGTSARIGIGTLASRSRWELVPLPSSSPAYTLPFDRKLEAWMSLRTFL